MQFDNTLLIQFALAVPLVAAFFAAVIPYRNVRDSFMLITSFALPFFIFKIYRFLFVKIGGVDLKLTVIEWKIHEFIPGVLLHFRVEALGLLFAIILAVLWPVSLVYAIGYMRKNNEGNLCRFFAFFCIAIFASLGLAFSANLLTLFIFYELITLATYPLVTHSRSVESKKSGRVYLGTLTATSGLFLLPAIILTFNAAGTTDFAAGGILTDKISSNFAMLILVLYIFGSAKAAIIPLHKWLTSAMVACTPVSALLHAVAVVNAGIFTIIKVIVYIFGISNLTNIAASFGVYGDWLLYFSAVTLIIASIIALTRDNFKELLAYSTISQLAYVVMALAMFSSKGIVAAILQMVAHSFAKIVMFFTQGSVYAVSHKKKISELSGMGRSMPYTFAAFSLAAISIIGLPPTIGFLAKWDMIEGAVEGDKFLVIVVIAISTVLNIAYFMPVIYKAFFEREKSGNGIIIHRKHGEAPLLMVIAAFSAAIMLVILFIWPEKLIAMANMVGK